jgi:TPR repeat protein
MVPKRIPALVVVLLLVAAALGATPAAHAGPSAKPGTTPKGQTGAQLGGGPLNAKPSAHPLPAPHYTRPKACEKLSDDDCFGLGNQSLRNGDAATAEQLHVNLCGLGYIRSCTMWGSILLADKYVPRDIARGRALLVYACDHQSATACELLAAASIDGQHGLPRDEATGTRFLVKACELGERRACFSLCDRIYEGRGAVQDMVAAADCYKMACDEGDALSCEALKDRPGLMEALGRSAIHGSRKDKPADRPSRDAAPATTPAGTEKKGN